MKNYTITVNGNVYDVTVEENGREETPQVSSARRPAPAARKATPSGKIQPPPEAKRCKTLIH